MDAPPLDAAGRDHGHLPSPVDLSARVRAVLFDLDGTLYDQPRVRRAMAWELITDLVLKEPAAAKRRLRGLREFRRAQESLRGGERPPGPLDRAQLEMAAQRASLPIDELRTLVQDWMQERPLKHLRRCAAHGLQELFDFLTAAHVPIGVFSDYPPHAKLRALGVAHACSVVLCATDPEIGAFKPDPRGFLVACRRWGLEPSEVLMVGDRADVDGVGAAAAGLPSVIIGREPAQQTTPGVTILSSLERLRRVFDGSHR